MDTLRNGQPFGYGKETSGEETKAARITGAGDVTIYSLFYLDARIWGTQKMFNV